MKIVITVKTGKGDKSTEKEIDNKIKDYINKNYLYISRWSNVRRF